MSTFSLRERKRRWWSFQTDPGGIQASLIFAKLLGRGTKAAEMKGARLTEDVGKARN